MTGSPAYRLTLIYPDERRVILTVLGVQASMSGGVSARRSSIVVQRRQGTLRETLCTIVFKDFHELAGTEAALDLAASGCEVSSRRGEHFSSRSLARRRPAAGPRRAPTAAPARTRG